MKLSLKKLKFRDTYYILLLQESLIVDFLSSTENL